LLKNRFSSVVVIPARLVLDPFGERESSPFNDFMDPRLRGDDKVKGGDDKMKGGDDKVKGGDDKVE
jgi:hypothetical protein